MTVTDHSKSIPQKRQVNTLKESATKWQIYTAADPTVERIIPSLAKEIGLNESIVLMQIAFWIKTSNNIVNGVYWTYQSMTEMQEKAFPYWSVDTIRRIVHKLQKDGFILVDQHNKRKGDNTQWYALEPDKLSTLKSIIVKEIEPEVVPPSSQVASMASSQVATPSLQDRTTLPEIPTDIENISAQKGAVKSRSSKNPTTPKEVLNPMADQVMAVFGWKWETASKNEKSKARGVAKQLCEIGRTPNEVPLFYAECKKRGWKDFSPNALLNVVSDVAKKTATKIIHLEPEPADYPNTADYVNLAGGA